ncbi:hypothetical protein EGR_11058 [Echinococcus granulosus]|uniref:Uncharacterized protein n=1 Tax=Echinococcus granulosus TaxID=6210 RepID=W6U0V8_ECHGR|nr:hypothetical protein EGR_11058 [Echinococcus granulosus]EUB54086.1 hypothetical protein EGR_11058 [Echinococcus granulosus]
MDIVSLLEATLHHLMIFVFSILCWDDEVQMRMGKESLMNYYNCSMSLPPVDEWKITFMTFTTLIKLFLQIMFNDLILVN